MDNDQQQKSYLLGLLFSTYQTRELSVDALTSQIKAYEMATDGATVADVDAAVKKFLSGDVPEHNPNFSPPAPMVGRVVRQEAMKRLEHDRIMTTFSKPQLAPPRVERTPETIAHVKAMAEAVATRYAKQGDERLQQHREGLERANEWHRERDPRPTAQRLGYSAGDGDARDD